jgi:predicted permease
MLIIIGFHSATFMPLTVALVQAGRGGESAVMERIVSVFGDVFRNPIILGILAGLVVNLVGLRLPSSVEALLGFLGAAAVPCALFAMGASLATYPLRGDVSPAVALTVLKLLVHPFLVWLVAGPVLGLDGIAVDVAIVLAAMPSAVNVYLFGARYQAAPGIAARTVLLTTVTSVLTLVAVLAMVGSR